MARAKTNYAHINTPFLQEYCETHGLKWAWKNESQGHMIIQSAELEAYVWVQRMTVQVRRRDGVDLSGSVATHMQNKIFNEADFTKLLNRGRGKRKKKAPPPLIPRAQYSTRPGVLGVVVVRIPRGTPPAEEQKARNAAREMALRICRSHEKDHYYEKGSWK